MPKSIRICPICQKEFFIKYPSQTYCSLKCFHHSKDKGTRVTTPSRFWAKVNKAGTDECWPWTGYINEDGYGRTSVKSRLIMAHRVAYEFEKGPIPENMSVCHKCDNPPCCNPNHLWLGSHNDNMRDKKEKSRFTIYKNEQNGYCKFSNEQVAELRKLYATGKYSMAKLSKLLGFSKSHTIRILKGVSRV